MIKFKDTMIVAMDFEKMIKFYNEYCELEIVEKTENWATLVDKETKQSLCITNGTSVRSTSPGFEVTDLDKALSDLERRGGSVVKKWEFGPMKGAHCSDPEKNEMMIWAAK